MSDRDRAAEVVVIGAGIGGLAVAARLAQSGVRVTLLEAHALPGGCASFFTRERCLFDVGATTLSGLAPGRPVARLLAALGVELPLHRCDPGLVVHDGRGAGAAAGAVRCFADPARWLAEAERAFAGEGDARGFFAAAAELEERAWVASGALRGFPPAGLREAFALLAPSRLRLAPLLVPLWTSVATMLARRGIASGSRCARFVDGQLAITTQRSAAETPWLLGTLGLGYARDTWAIDGGLNRLARELARAVVRRGGAVRYRARVVGLARDAAPDEWRVALADGSELRARSVVANVTLDALARLAPPLRGWAERKRRGGVTVGAFTLYAGIPDGFDDLGTPFHQLVLERPLPHLRSTSLFLSFSRAGEAGRAPPGRRVVTISTHVESPHEWTRGRFAAGGAAVAEIAAAIRAAVVRVFPRLGARDWSPCLPGTPRTFERYTARPDGQVGGLGHAFSNPPWRWAGARTPLPRLYLVGDHAFPGQGTPAVVQSAEAVLVALRSDAADGGRNS